MTSGGVPHSLSTWLEIDLAGVERNAHDLVGDIGGRSLMAVVKANGYGYGALEVARAAVVGGAQWLGVARVGEGVRLRRTGLLTPCLVLGYTPPSAVPEAVEADLAVTVFDSDVLLALERQGQERGAQVRAHLKVDSGLGRLGVTLGGLGPILRQARKCPHVSLEGIFTHLRSGEDAETTARQVASFHHFLALASEMGHHFPIRHLANSSGWQNSRTADATMVRSGLELLGLRTGDGRSRRPVLQWHARIAQVRQADAGEFVGYGTTGRLRRRTPVGTLAVGYADGFRRSPRTWGFVLVHGEPCAIVGQVSMDMSMVDLSAAMPVQAGEVATLIGTDGDNEITVEDAAERLGTVNYEVVTSISERVGRVYWRSEGG